MNVVHISSRTNSRYKLARALQRRRGRRQHAQLLLEGVRLINDSMSAGFPPALVLFDPQVAGVARALVERAGAAEIEISSLEPALLAELCETVTPQGVVAVAPWPQLTPGEEGLSVVVDGVRDPGNLGTLLRSAAAAGADQVVLLPGVTDPWAPKVLRAGMGAHFRVAIRTAEDVAQLQDMLGQAQLLLATADAAEGYTAIDWTQPSALIIGGEAAGARAAMHLAGVRRIGIPMRGRVESLNAAVAASVILFEAARQRGAGKD